MHDKRSWGWVPTETYGEFWKNWTAAAQQRDRQLPSSDHQSRDACRQSGTPPLTEKKPNVSARPMPEPPDYRRKSRATGQS